MIPARRLRVAVLHNEVSPDGRADDRDTLVQARAVQEALGKLGHAARCVSCTLDLETARRELLAGEFDLAFNLVEALGGTDRLGYLAAGLLDALGLPYTGSGTQALLVTVDKLLTKRRLAELGLPAPPAFMLADLARPESPQGVSPEFPAAFIVKTLAEHASFGIENEAIRVCRSRDELARHLAEREALLERICFAEPFIAGREFNVAVLAQGDGGPGQANEPHVLPIGEIDFGGLPAGAPHIVDYRAKWDEQSHQYHHTPRRFDLPPSDALVVRRLAELAQACWRGFDLAGYVRVDFRVDRAGRPFVLEINANPCLAPDAGFAGTLAAAGIPFAAAIDRIVTAALAGSPRSLAQETCP